MTCGACASHIWDPGNFKFPPENLPIALRGRHGGLGLPGIYQYPTCTGSRIWSIYALCNLNIDILAIEIFVCTNCAIIGNTLAIRTRDIRSW